MNNAPHLDFLIRLKNAYLSGKKTVKVPSSKMIVSLCQLLKRFKLITDYQVPSAKERILSVDLNYSSSSPAFTNVKIFSTPGRRWYEKSSSLPWGKSPNSLIIISTSQGLISQKEANKKGLGGEIIAELY